MSEVTPENIQEQVNLFRQMQQQIQNLSQQVSQMDMTIGETQRTLEEIETVDDKEQESGPSLKKCLMKAKSMKDKKNCQKENMQTVEEFIEDEGLKLIES